MQYRKQGLKIVIYGLIAILTTCICAGLVKTFDINILPEFKSEYIVDELGNPRRL